MAKTFHKNERPKAKATLKKCRKKGKTRKIEHTTKHPHQAFDQKRYSIQANRFPSYNRTHRTYTERAQSARSVVCLYSANTDFKHKKTIMPIYLNKYVRKCIHSRMFPTIWSVRHCHFNMSAFLFCGLFFIRCVAFGTFIWLVFASMIVQCCCFFFCCRCCCCFFFRCLLCGRTFYFKVVVFFLSFSLLYFTALYIIFYGSTPAIVIGNLYGVQYTRQKYTSCNY